MKKFKAGDIVRIKTWDEMLKIVTATESRYFGYFAIEFEGSRTVFIDLMKEFSNCTATVVSVSKISDRIALTDFKRNGKLIPTPRYTFIEEMLEFSEKNNTKNFR